MFKFQTTTVLNDFSRVVAPASGSGVLKIKYLGDFDKDSIVKVFKREGTEGTEGISRLPIVAGADPTGDYRILLYVKLVGSNNSNYANDMVFKGKPYAFEFSVNSTSVGADNATKIANAAKAAIDKEAARFGRTHFDVTISAAEADDPDTANVDESKPLELVIAVTGEDAKYINITECKLQKYDAEANSSLTGGEYKDLAEGVPTPCENPFGTYEQILKDLRLPTPENTGWTSLNNGKGEMPLFGQVYDQYLIYMCKNRGIMGGFVVGMPVQSITAHSIWVKQGADSTNFENYLKNATNAGTPGLNKTVEDYDAGYNSGAASEGDLQG